MDVGGERIKVKEMSDILAARYAFLSGGRVVFFMALLLFGGDRKAKCRKYCKSGLNCFAFSTSDAFGSYNSFCVGPLILPASRGKQRYRPNSLLSRVLTLAKCNAPPCAEIITRGAFISLCISAAMAFPLELLLLALMALRVYARLFAVALYWFLKLLHGNAPTPLKASTLRSVRSNSQPFISGARTRDGFPVMTFPDSRVQMSYPHYHLLVTYLLQVPP